MISLLLSFCVLIIGFFFYGKFTEKIFAPDERPTPAIASSDGVDKVPMKNWKAFLIQFLNIAGTGPIFGALMGACFGPIVFLWIVLGSVFGGAVHDYFSGMISVRNGGNSIAEISGVYLGKGTLWFMRAFCILMMILVGAVFITSPASLLAKLTPEFLNKNFWVAVIAIYYILATILPIDKVIGRLYPVFGVILLFMAAGIFVSLVFNSDYTIPEITFENLNPSGTSVWPYMFVTVACGAVSGFHATQSPMIAKCITTEKAGRNVFYGAMISESVIALVWAAAGVTFYATTGGLQNALNELGQSGVVYEISTSLLGSFGGALAVIGVIVCPITTGDTAFRTVRLILAEIFHIDQRQLWKRVALTLPILAVGIIITTLDFDVLWRYFSWSNQTLAMISLWISTSYLVRNCKYKFGSLITALPASFMSAVSVTYILMSSEGFGISASVGYPVGIAFALALFCIYAFLAFRYKKNGKIK